MNTISPNYKAYSNILLIVVCYLMLCSFSSSKTFHTVHVIPRTSVQDECETKSFNVHIVKQSLKDEVRKENNSHQIKSSLHKLKSKWNIVVKKKIDFFSTYGFFSPIVMNKMEIKSQKVSFVNERPFLKRVKIKKKAHKSIFSDEFVQSFAQAKYEGKLVLIDFGADWCVPCQIFEEYTLVQPSVKAYLSDNYIVQHVDIESFDGIALKDYYKIKLLPTILILDSNKKILVNIF